MSGFKSHENSLLQSLALDGVFTNEDRLVEEISYSTVPNWESFFQSSISRTVIAMVATQGDHYQAEKPEIQDQLHEEIVHVTPAQKLKPSIEHSGIV